MPAEPEVYQGRFPSRVEAEQRAGELRDGGYDTRIAESMFWLGQWVVIASPRIDEEEAA